MRLPLVALAAVAALSLPVAAAAAGLPAVPIPSDPRDPLVTPFTGAAATPSPLGAQPVPRHPFMAANGASNIHDDAYQTDAYDGPGPLGPDLTVRSTLFAAECASVTFDSRGRIVTVCVSPLGATLRLIDPVTLATLASQELPLRKVGTFSFDNFAGGGYFYLDHQDRAVLTTFTGHLQTYAETTGLQPGFRLERDVDLTPATAGADIVSALPDWSGRIWFVAKSGVVGFVAADDSVHSLSLPAGETIANSFAVDESGGVFVVSTHALYRLDVAAGEPSVTWRQPYDRGTRVKPGQVSQGSGTTPTLIGSASSPGGGAVAITDNADPQMHVLVFRRGAAGSGAAPLCEQAVFPAGQGDDENSLISVPGGLIAENNYGYAGPLSGFPGRTVDTTPGLVRVDVDVVAGGCHVAWENTTARVPTLVSKVSLATGLLYAYTHPAASELPLTLPLPDLLAPDAWFLTAFDARTGRQVWSRHVGSGLGHNNNYAPVTLGPDGTAYVGTLGGLVRIADR
jgi:outer membrane protein assembly factor BamB